jgi:hypothetical protein
MVMLTLEFLLGQLLSVIKRMDLVLQSPKNEASTLGDFARHYGIRTIFEIAVGIGIFNGVFTNTWLLGKIWQPLAAFQWSWGSAFAVGLIFHYLADWAMERYPALRNVLGG